MTNAGGSTPAGHSRAAAALRGLGRSGLSVTAMGLGAAPLSHRAEVVPNEDAHGAVRAAYDAGVGLFDVAPFYGYGAGEHRVGHVLRDQPRDSYVLSTKVGRLLKPCPMERVDKSIWVETLAFQPVFDYGYDGTMRSVDDSLQRLGIDRIDILHIHDVDHGTHGSHAVAQEHFEAAMAGAYPALVRLRDEGVVRAIGCGLNFAEWALKFLAVGDFDCLMLAGRYTLLEQQTLDDLLPLCAERGIGLMLGGVFNSGILATGPRPGAWHHYAPAEPTVLERVSRMQAICASHGVPLSAAAIQFPLGHPSVGSVVLGAISEAEVAENVRSIDVDIPDDVWAELKHEKLIREDAPVPRARS
jgi:D-threo-aldose 1-dehydrogenase